MIKIEREESSSLRPGGGVSLRESAEETLWSCRRESQYWPERSVSVEICRPRVVLVAKDDNPERMSELHEDSYQINQGDIKKHANCHGKDPLVRIFHRHLGHEISNEVTENRRCCREEIPKQRSLVGKAGLQQNRIITWNEQGLVEDEHHSRSLPNHLPSSCGSSWQATVMLVVTPDTVPILNAAAIAKPSAKLWILSPNKTIHPIDLIAILENTMLQFPRLHWYYFLIVEQWDSSSPIRCWIAWPRLEVLQLLVRGCWCWSGNCEVMDYLSHELH